jgi:hypothetical protein
MSEIPEHLLQRAQAARIKAGGVLGDRPRSTRPERVLDFSVSELVEFRTQLRDSLSNIHTIAERLCFNTSGIGTDVDAMISEINETIGSLV